MYSDAGAEFLKRHRDGGKVYNDFDIRGHRGAGRLLPDLRRAARSVGRVRRGLDHPALRQGRPDRGLQQAQRPAQGVGRLGPGLLGRRLPDLRPPGREIFPGHQAVRVPLRQPGRLRLQPPAPGVPGRAGAQAGRGAGGADAAHHGRQLLLLQRGRGHGRARVQKGAGGRPGQRPGPQQPGKRLSPAGEAEGGDFLL